MAIDPDRLRSWPIPEVCQSYGERDTILYALGIGCGGEPGDLRYVYEEGLQVVPSMATVLGYPGFWLRDPGTGVNWRRAVHGAQAFELLRPLPPSGTVVGRSRVGGLVDKGPGRGALLTTLRDVVDAASGEVIARLTHTAFLREEGGFSNGPPEPGEVVTPMPDRPPDHVVALPTLPQAALIYRLSGDMNPLHADPAVAAAAGFPRPILHGLCTLGFATRAVLRATGDQPSQLRRLSARFSAPVLPGETIRTEMWREDGRMLFQSRVAERDVVALAHGIAEFGPFTIPAPSR